MNQSKADRFSRGGGVRELPLEQAQPAPVAWETVPWKKVVAFILWCVGVWCTRYVTGAVFEGGLAWVAAIILQAGLTFLESPLWRRWAYDMDGNAYRRPMGALAFFALALDALFNIVGTWALVGKVHTLPFVQSIGEMFGTVVQPLRGAPAFLLCIVLAIGLCASPERLYWDED